VGVKSDLMDKGAVGDRIVKRKRLFQMRSGKRKSAAKHQGSTGGQMGQDKPGGIVALKAYTQQVLVQALCQIQFAAEQVMERLPMRNPKELRREIELLPQFSRPDIGMAGFRCCHALYRSQHRA
jgi:hypothetical protein